MQAQRIYKNCTAGAILIIALAVLIYLVMESRQRSNQIDKALKQIPSTIK